jgi:hypothetical protein
MKTIVKHFDSLKKAEQYQDKLYDKYDHVRLVRWPSFSEAGDYAWEVK